MQLADGAAAGLRLLHQNGFQLIVVSNQSGVARGLFAESALSDVANRLAQLFEAAGARCAGFYYCPHHPEGSVPQYARACFCRKPAPGLLIRAAAEHEIDLARSWMVGNARSDVEAGQSAGCATVLISSDDDPRASSGLVAHDLCEAAEVIVRARWPHSTSGLRDTAGFRLRLR
jgi:D-glycero-D-manno-heptose 1,7-bisphosphate phosphatase